MSKSKKSEAVALRYNSAEDIAPVVIASGYGAVAERIIDIAEKQGIPVFRDDSATSLLCMLEVGSNIPPQLYELVAAIYGQLLQTSAKIKNLEAASAQSTPTGGSQLLTARKRREAARSQQQQQNP